MHPATSLVDHIFEEMIYGTEGGTCLQRERCCIPAGNEDKGQGVLKCHMSHMVTWLTESLKLIPFSYLSFN